MLELVQTKKTDARLLKRMAKHYTGAKGFVGRSICYAVLYNGFYYGHIVGGSAIRNLPKERHRFLGTDNSQLDNIVNNVFFNISPLVGKKYPEHNFTTLVLKEWMHEIARDWYTLYGNSVVGFETLVELPRTGEVYLKAGWTQVATTRGFTCKRVSSNGRPGWHCELVKIDGQLEIKWIEDKRKGLDSWTGKREWNKTDLKPKSVFCYRWEG